MAEASVPVILLVEDDEGDALLVRECLRETGIGESNIVWRRTANEGVEALATDPTCVLLDLGLPDSEGLEALLTLVAQRTQTPVIVLTGRHDRTGVDAVAAGAQDYLIKDDITPELLDRSIRYAVSRRQAQITELQLHEERVLAAENSRMERRLLPRPLLRSEFVHCFSHYQPGRAGALLSGDFFDVVETQDGSIRAIIGDVMGHGPDEAALGVHLRVAWRGLVLAGVPGDQILDTLSALLDAESGGGIFATVCDLTLSRDLAMTVRVAGHPPPLVCLDGKADYLDVEVGPPLGVQLTASWPVTRTTISRDSSLVLYTDGLLDAYRSPQLHDSVGLDELLVAFESAMEGTDERQQLVSSVVTGAPQQAADDTAVVLLGVGAP